MRPVAADQVRFIESLEAYRPGSVEHRFRGHRDLSTGRAYLLASFCLTVPVTTTRFSVGPATQVVLPSPRNAFIVPVDLQVEDPGIGTAQRAAEAVAAIMSVAYDRPFVSPRDPLWTNSSQLTEDNLRSLAVQYNVITAGPGYQMPQLSTDYETSLAKSAAGLADTLDHLADTEFVQILQAIRLHHLGLVTRRMDFELGFALVVASLEAMAQIAIDRVETASLRYTDVELQIKEFCEAQGGDVGGWFKQKVRDQAKLKARYLEYIFRYAPVDRWSEVRHPLHDMIEYMNSARGETTDPNAFPLRGWDETYPNELDESTLRAIMGKTYDDRSGFIHSGARSTHDQPNPHSRFFETIDVWDHYGSHQLVVPRFETLSTIARVALVRYLDVHVREGESRPQS